LTVKKALSVLLGLLLLLYSVVVLVSLLFKPLISLRLIVLPFYIFVPGYAFTTLFLPRLRAIEKVIASLGLSLALFLGIKSFIYTFSLEYFFQGSVILSIISILFLVSNLILEMFRGK